MEPFFHEALAHASHRRRRYFQRFADGFVAPGRSRWAAVSFQQKAGREQRPGRGFAAANHLGKVSLLLRG